MYVSSSSNGKNSNSNNRHGGSPHKVEPPSAFHGKIAQKRQILCGTKKDVLYIQDLP